MTVTQTKMSVPSGADKYTRLAELGQVDEAHVVVDLSTGTVTGTQGILERLNPQAYFMLVDVYDPYKFVTNGEQRPTNKSATLNGGRRIHQRKRQLSRLPLPHKWVDVVYCSFDLRDLNGDADREALLAEAKRILKANGRLLMVNQDVVETTPLQAQLAQLGLQLQQREPWADGSELLVLGKQE